MHWRLNSFERANQTYYYYYYYQKRRKKRHNATRHELGSKDEEKITFTVPVEPVLNRYDSSGSLLPYDLQTLSHAFTT